jgi:hypothetical protein
MFSPKAMRTGQDGLNSRHVPSKNGQEQDTADKDIKAPLDLCCRGIASLMAAASEALPLKCG